MVNPNDKFFEYPLKWPYSNAFKNVIPFILENEGGYVNNPLDKGGETNQGISKARYPHLSIKDLTDEQIKELYFIDYFLKFNLQDIKDSAKAKTTLDFLVNSGKAPFIIQQMLKENFYPDLEKDGIIGPITIEAINNVSKNSYINLLNKYRLNYMKTLSSWEHFKNGWQNRIEDNLALIGGGGSTLTLLIVLGLLYFKLR